MEREKSLLEEILELIVVLFTSESVVSFGVFLSFFLFSCLEAPLCTTICMTVKHVFERYLNCLTQLFNFFTYSFYRVPPIFFEPEGVYFGSPASQIPTVVDDGEVMVCNYLHAMVGVRKEVWLGDFCMKLSFK